MFVSENKHTLKAAHCLQTKFHCTYSILKRVWLYSSALSRFQADNVTERRNRWKLKDYYGMGIKYLVMLLQHTSQLDIC